MLTTTAQCMQPSPSNIPTECTQSSAVARHRVIVAVELVRPLVLGTLPADVWRPLAILAGYAGAGYYAALVLTRRRFFR